MEFQKNEVDIYLKDKITTSCRALFQYDYGIKLNIYNLTLDENEDVRFQFVQDNEQITNIAEYNSEKGCFKVNFPDKFLKNDNEVNCFIYLNGADYGKTKKIINFQIFDREMFGDIPDEVTEDIIGQIFTKLNELEEQMTQVELTDEQLEYIASKIDLTGYVRTEDLNDFIKSEDLDDYVKTEDLNDYVTNEEMGQALSSLNQSVISITNALGERIGTVETAVSNLAIQVNEANAILEVI